MSRANESAPPPAAERKVIAAIDFRRSTLMWASEGRYQATTRIPAPCAASMNSLIRRGNTMSGWEKFELWR